ncbi:hypothetical protein ACXWTF_05645 [Thiomicrolovo sp. ZZH C-3]
MRNGDVAGKLLLLVSMTIVIGAIVAGMMMIDSPAKERAEKLDKRRIDDLAKIALTIDRYWERHQKLPADLDALQAGVVSDLETEDPKTQKRYRYHPTASSSYELCAAFDTKQSKETWTYRYGRDRNWSHTAGEYCFALEPYKK